MTKGTLPRGIRNSVKRQAQHLLETGSRFKRFDQIRQRHFWSTQLFLPDVNGYIQSGTFRTFITPPGQAGQGFPLALTEHETNWKSANRVPDNQNFEVLELGVGITTLNADLEVDVGDIDNEPPNPRQANAFAQNTILAIQYLTNEISLGFISDFSQASGSQMGSYQPASTVAPNTINPILPGNLFSPPSSRFLINGFSAPALRRRFKIPILLQHGETFSFNLVVPRTFWVGTVDVTMRVEFWATESFVEKS